MNASIETVCRLEVAGLNSWAAESQVQVGGWVARLGDGYTKRANSVTALSDHRGDVATDVAHCEALYLARGLTPIFRLTAYSQPAVLDAFLAKRGYQVVDPTLVLTRPAEAGAWPAGVDRCADVTEWLAAYAQLTNGTVEKADAHLALLNRVILPTVHLIFRDETGRPVGCVLGVRDRELVGAFDLIVQVDRRRQGYGHALMRALMSWANEKAAETVYLQVVEANDVALWFYGNLGFCRAYRYWYRIPGGAGGTPC